MYSTSFRRIPEMLEESKIIILMVDGLGSIDLRIPRARKRVYQTVFPTSTPTFLYTFHSLLRPEEHGFLEWYMRFRGSTVAIPPWEDAVNSRELILGKDVSKDEVSPLRLFQRFLSRKVSQCYTIRHLLDLPSLRLLVKELKLERLSIYPKYSLWEKPISYLSNWPSVDSIRHERYEKVK